MRSQFIQCKFEAVVAETTARHCRLCDHYGMKRQRTCAWILAMLLMAGGLALQGQPQPAETNSSRETGSVSTLATNAEAATNSTVETSQGQALNDAPENQSRSDAESAEPSPTPASSDKSGFRPFQIIAERNIFNGNRSGQRISSTRSSSQQRYVRVDAFSLVGTMVSEKGPVAFFDGTESDFRKAFKAGGRIGGFEIRDVRFAGVRLAQGTNTVDLAVGTGMRREDRGLWKPTSGGASFSSGNSGGTGYSSNSASHSSSSRYDSSSRYSGGSSRDRSADETTASTPSSTGGSGASTADMDEILKRLMEKREKE